MDDHEYKKAWWAPFRSGLFNDPKHRKKMGSAIWLYGYLQIYADRETGRLERNLQTIASDLETEWKTVQRWMAILKKNNYVELRRMQYGFSIQVTKWRSISKQKRPDKNRMSDKPRYDNPVPQIGHFEDSDMTFLSRQDKNGMSVNGCNNESYDADSTNIGHLKKGFKESNKKKNGVASKEKPQNHWEEAEKGLGIS